MRKASELMVMFLHCAPGEHWRHVQRQLPKEDALEMGAAPVCVRTPLLALLPVYRFRPWDPDGA